MGSPPAQQGPWQTAHALPGTHSRLQCSSGACYLGVDAAVAGHKLKRKIHEAAMAAIVLALPKGGGHMSGDAKRRKPASFVAGEDRGILNTLSQSTSSCSLSSISSPVATALAPSIAPTALNAQQEPHCAANGRLTREPASSAGRAARGGDRPYLRLVLDFGDGILGTPVDRARSVGVLVPKWRAAQAQGAQAVVESERAGGKLVEGQVSIVVHAKLRGVGVTNKATWRPHQAVGWPRRH